MPTKDHLKKEKVIAEKDGYQLLEKHAIIYLHNWLVNNDSVDLEAQIKYLLCSLKSDFDLSPEHTIGQLEHDAKTAFENLKDIFRQL